MLFKKSFLIFIFFNIQSVGEEYKKIINFGPNEKKQLVKRIENIQKLVEYLQTMIEAFLKKDISPEANWSDKERIKLLINEQIKLQMEAFELQLLMNTRI